MITTLFSTSAHNSRETAYVIKDWPYGRTLRCEKHIWIETRKNFGQRACYATKNPKRNNIFNANKNGNYSPFTIFGADKDGLLEFDGASHYSKPEKFTELRALPLDAEQLQRLNDLERACRKYNSPEWVQWDEFIKQSPPELSTQ